MATSKTLAPTNVTISIPAMTDAPNASVLANCADKEADAINALNSQSAKKAEKRIAAGESAVFTFSNYQTAALIFCASGNTNATLYIYSNGYMAPVATDTDVTVTLSQDYKTVTVTNASSSRVFHVGCVSSNIVPTVT